MRYGVMPQAPFYLSSNYPSYKDGYTGGKIASKC